MIRPTSAKVLRIAVLCDGRILTERLMDAGTTVRIGSNATNDLVVPNTDFGTSIPLFSPTPAGYALTTLPDMHGKVTVHSEPASVRALVADGATHIRVSTDDRGKLVVGRTTVLFQFVAPPPTAAHLLPGNLDFRPRLFEEDDPIFLGATSLFTGLAAVMLAWVYTSPPPAIVDVIELDPRIGRIIMLPPPLTPEPIVDVDPIAEPVPVVAEVPQEPEIAEVPAQTEGMLPDGRNIADLNRDELQEVVERDPFLIELIAGVGADAGQAVGSLFDPEDDGITDIDAMLENAGGVEVADGRNDSQRRGEGTNNGDVDIDISQMARIPGGTVGPTEAVVVELIGVVDVGDFEPEPDIEDPEAIQTTVRDNRGRMAACYDRILKTNPGLQGRVDIEFYISQGRVAQAQVFADTTHNSAFTGCLTDAVRRIRFPAGTDGQVVFPFVFSPQH